MRNLFRNRRSISLIRYANIYLEKEIESKIILPLNRNFCQLKVLLHKEDIHEHYFQSKIEKCDEAELQVMNETITRKNNRLHELTNEIKIAKNGRFQQQSMCLTIGLLCY